MYMYHHVSHGRLREARVAIISGMRPVGAGLTQKAVTTVWSRGPDYTFPRKVRLARETMVELQHRFCQQKLGLVKS